MDPQHWFLDACLLCFCSFHLVSHLFSALLFPKCLFLAFPPVVCYLYSFLSPIYPVLWIGIVLMPIRIRIGLSNLMLIQIRILLQILLLLEKHNYFDFYSRVADPHYFNPGPDPAFYLIVMRIWIQLFPLMWIRFRIHLIFKVMGIGDHWTKDSPRLHFEPPSLHCEPHALQGSIMSL